MRSLSLSLSLSLSGGREGGLFCTGILESVFGAEIDEVTEAWFTAKGPCGIQSMEMVSLDTASTEFRE